MAHSPVNDLVDIFFSILLKIRLISALRYSEEQILFSESLVCISFYLPT